MQLHRLVVLRERLHTHSTLMSSASAEYLTPPWILDLVEKVAPIGLDPCAHAKSEAIRRTRTGFMLNPPSGFADRGVVFCDGLMMEWEPYVKPSELIFVNPPYGRALKDWAAKMAAETDCTIIALVPARVDTAWWRELNPSAWCALAGRVKFLSLEHEWEPSTISGLSWTCKLCNLTTNEPLKHLSCSAATPSETGPAPFPSAICLLHARSATPTFNRFVEAFKDAGPIYQRVQQ